MDAGQDRKDRRGRGGFCRSRNLLCPPCDWACAEPQTPETNPYGLADGVTYYTHHVEEYDPSQPPSQTRTSRRSTSLGLNGNGSGNGLNSGTPGEPSISRVLPSTTPTQARRRSIPTAAPLPTTNEDDLQDAISPELPAETPFTPGQAAFATRPAADRGQSGYFPAMSSIMPPPLITPLQQQSSTPTRPAQRLTASRHSPETDSLEVSGLEPPASLPPPRPSTLSASTTTAPSPPNPPGLSPPVAPASTQANITPTTSTPPPAIHRRVPSRHSPITGSSISNLGGGRETPSAIFAPSSLGRPASVASSHSSHIRGFPSSSGAGPSLGPGTIGKSAPAMAITTSGEDSLASSAILESRRTSASYGQGRSPSSIGGTPNDHGFGSISRTMPGALTAFSPASGPDRALALAGESRPQVGPLQSDTPSGGIGGVSAVARSISRGFSIAKKRSTSSFIPTLSSSPSGTGGGSDSGGGSGSGTRADGGQKSQQTAADILKQYGKG